MSANSCFPNCETPVVSMVPGTGGDPGNDGSNGTNGKDAYTQAVLGASVVVAKAANAVITVANGLWASAGMIIFIDGAGFFEVVSASANSITATYLSISANADDPATIADGSVITPCGPQYASPVPIADGGTGAATKAAAQLGLGLGQNVTVASVAGLTQVITNAPTLVAGATVTVPAAGLYLILAMATVGYSAATFAARLLTVRVQNTTAATTISSSIKLTQSPDAGKASASYDYSVPFKTATLTAGHVLQLQVGLDTVNSAGTAQVNEASIVIIPLALS